MTEPDTYLKSGNLLLALAVGLGVASLCAASLAHFWDRPFDYWLVWASFATGFGTVVTAAAGIVFHLVRFDSLRSN